eukprot:2965608-Prymnesium_polylepis.3
MRAVARPAARRTACATSITSRRGENSHAKRSVPGRQMEAASTPATTICTGLMTSGPSDGCE